MSVVIALRMLFKRHVLTAGGRQRSAGLSDAVYRSICDTSKRYRYRRLHKGGRVQLWSRVPTSSPAGTRPLFLFLIFSLYISAFRRDHITSFKIPALEVQRARGSALPWPGNDGWGLLVHALAFSHRKRFRRWESHPYSAEWYL